MKSIFKDKFSEILFDSEKSLLEHIVFSETENMNEESFKIMLKEYLKATLDTQAKYSLVDVQNFLFVVSPELQAWTVELLQSVPSAIKKMAYLMPDAFVESIAIEQLGEDHNAAKLFTQYFKDKNQAMAWLLK